MTRKDYKAVADVLKGNCLHNDLVCLIDDFVVIFKKDGKAFDEGKFRKACDGG